MGTSSFIGPFGTSSGGGGGGSVNSVTGTVHQITSSGGTDPVISLPDQLFQTGDFMFGSTTGNVILFADGQQALVIAGDSGQVYAAVAMHAPLYALNEQSELTADGPTNAILADFSQLKGLRIEYNLDPVVQLQNLAGDDGAVIDVKSMQVLGTPGATGTGTNITVVGGIVTAIS